MPRQLTIYRRLFFQSDCYRAGVKQQQVGVQVHSTGANNPWLHRYVAPDDGRIGRNQYGNHSNQPGSSVCASAYIGKQTGGKVSVYQTLPWDFRCWLSGSGSAGNANRIGYIGFEICEDGLDSPQYYSQAMDQAVLLTAYLCQEIGTDPTRALGGGRLAVMDHAELHACGVASGHKDVGHWLRKYGHTMDDFRAWVARELEDGVQVLYIDCDEVPGGDNMQKTFYASNGGYINIRDRPGGASTAMIRPGSKCEAEEAQGGWRKVTITGYVKDEFLR